MKVELDLAAVGARRVRADLDVVSGLDRWVAREALDDAVDAVFKSLDLDGDKAIDFREMNHLLVRSFQARPHLPPLELHSENAIQLRKSKLNKANSNLMQGMQLDSLSEEDVPNQIRLWMSKNLIRVRDVFLQLDDDNNGKVDRIEFRKAMREMGCCSPIAAVDALFRSLDADGSKAIDYRELHKLLVRSVRAHHLRALSPLHGSRTRKV